MFLKVSHRDPEVVPSEKYKVKTFLRSIPFPPSAHISPAILVLPLFPHPPVQSLYPRDQRAAHGGDLTAAVGETEN